LPFAYRRHNEGATQRSSRNIRRVVFLPGKRGEGYHQPILTIFIGCHETDIMVRTAIDFVLSPRTNRYLSRSLKQDPSNDSTPQGDDHVPLTESESAAFDNTPSTAETSRLPSYPCPHLTSKLPACSTSKATTSWMPWRMHLRRHQYVSLSHRTASGSLEADAPALCHHTWKGIAFEDISPAQATDLLRSHERPRCCENRSSDLVSGISKSSLLLPCGLAALTIVNYGDTCGTLSLSC
jgi:hypothetical protein